MLNCYTLFTFDFTLLFLVMRYIIPGFLVRRPSCLELAAGILAPSFIPFRVQTLSEDILVQVAKRI